MTDASLPFLSTMLNLVQLHIFSCGLTGEGQVHGDRGDGKCNYDHADACSSRETGPDASNLI